MPTSSVLPDAVGLLRRLAGLRRRSRFVAAARGISLLLAVAAAAVVIAGLLDWRWHLPSLVRAAALVGTLAAIGIVFFHQLLKPLRTPVDDLSLALRIEELNPGLNDSLASAVQFLQPKAEGTGQGDSQAMRREAIRQALKRSAGCEFGRIVERRGLRLAVVGMLAACATVAVLVWLDPAQAATALTRLGDPFGSHEWPRHTRIELEQPRTRIGRNEAFDVRGVLHGVIPEKATVIFRFDNMPPMEHECDVSREGSDLGRLSTRLDAGRVQRNFRFKVYANDAETEEYQVQVLPPPMLVPIDGRASPQVELRPPAYTDLPSPQELPAGSGNIEAVAGTVATLRAAADRPLRGAWIEYQPEGRFTQLAAYLSPLGANHVAGVVGLAACGQTVWDRVPAQLEEDQCAFSITFYPRVAGLYVLHFEDETGLANSRVFELRLRSDPAPTVQLERPSPSRDVLAVLPDAELILHASAEDPYYALRSVFVEYRTQRTDEPRRFNLYDQDAVIRGGAGPLGGVAVQAVPWRMRPVRLEFRRVLPLKKVTHANGSTLKEGDVVVLQAAADDFDDVTVNKLPGRSAEVEIRIVSREAIELILNQKQAEVQQELLRLREKEREALAKVIEAERKLKRGERLTNEDRNKLLEAEQTQHQIRERVGTPQDGLRSEVDRVLDIIRQNGLRDSAARERMVDVARELDRLADKELEPIAPRLSAARKQAEMLEEAVRAERHAQMEDQARETEMRGRAAEQAAKARADEAKQSEQRAEQSSGAAKAREQDESRRLRQQAEDLRQRARELALQAARERREANEAPKKDQPATELADARRHQEEVERTLNDLLNRLEPWSSSREIKGEAGRILQEERELKAKVEDLQLKVPQEVRENLTDGQRAELDEMKAAQQKLEERARQLFDKMKRVADERAAKDPETAQELREAHERGAKGDITGQMKTARDEIQANRLNEAGKAQQRSIDELGEVVKMLEDRREAELDRLAKKLRQVEDRLDELTHEQEELHKKTQDAGNIADPKEREEELKKLARRQEKLREDTREMVKELSRLRAGRAGQALSQADRQMGQAEQRMRAGQRPDKDNEEEALDRLDEARREVQKVREEVEESLTREQMARVADAILRLRDRQQGLITEASRIQAEVLRAGKPGAASRWPRASSFSWSDLGRAQTGLAQEVESLASSTAKKELADTPVFRRLLIKAGETMNDAVKRMEVVGKQPVVAGSLPDVETDKLQQLALKRLEQLAEALKPEDEGMRQAGGGGGGGDGEGGDGPEGNGLPPLGQLKLLRAMQSQVNERTDVFRNKHRDLKKLTEADKAELQAIRRDQKEVADLLEELMRPAGEPDDEEGERK